MVNPGDVVREKITGFCGVATCRTTFLNGCIRLCVRSKELQEGKPVDEYFDEADLDVVEAAKEVSEAPEEGPSGPRPNPLRRADPVDPARHG